MPTGNKTANANATRNLKNAAQKKMVKMSNQPLTKCNTGIAKQNMLDSFAPCGSKKKVEKTIKLRKLFRVLRAGVTDVILDFV